VVMAPVTTVTEEIEIIDAGGNGGDGGGGLVSGGGPGGSGDGGGDFGSSEVPQRAYVTGMTVGLAAILMFFLALVSAFIVRKGFPNGNWQPLTPPRVLWLNTLVLLASSATIVRARRLLTREDLAGYRQWWFMTTALGVLFLAGQVLAWRQLAAAGVFLASNPASSFFYVFTAAHGLHLLGGVIALIFVAARHTRRLTRSTAVEVVSIYWHFMDGLWVFLFLLLFLGR
jgi:cytochrome c oxidase subunit III